MHCAVCHGLEISWDVYLPFFLLRPVRGSGMYFKTTEDVGLNGSLRKSCGQYLRIGLESMLSATLLAPPESARRATGGIKSLIDA